MNEYEQILLIKPILLFRKMTIGGPGTLSDQLLAHGR